MNEVIENIKKRRSIRAFNGKRIEKEKLEQLVVAAQYAPSAMNRQLCKFTVVQNPEKIKQLYSVIADKLDRDADYNFYGATVMILVSSEKNSPHNVEDCACALENIFLAATALDIGSVWINQLKGICDIPSVRKVLDSLNLPQDHAVYGMAALGYFDETPDNRIKKTDNVEWVL